VGELTGHARLAEGREAEIFEWADGTVLRLARDPASGARTEQAAAAMRLAAAAGVPVPQVHEVVMIDGRPGIVMERVEGVDLLTDLGRRPWRLATAASLLATLQHRIHERRAPGDLRELREDVRERIGRADALEPRLERFALATLDRLASGDQLCHGDYHPGNVLLAPGGPVVIDWSNVTRGHPAADVARTRLMFRLGDLPPGSPALIRALERYGRGAFVRLYLRHYARERRFEPTLLDQWEIVRAADRFSEGIEPEYPALHALLERAASG
jgi:aminoglycoside phosphotransferase (APT) family kinase protein